jgi:hypothetical protein
MISVLKADESDKIMGVPMPSELAEKVRQVLDA